MSFLPNTAGLAALLDRLSDEIWPLATELTSPNLLSGKAGISLFYAHVYLHSGQERDFERFTQLVEQSIQAMAADSLDETLSGGLAGTMWLIRHLSRISLLEDPVAEELASLEEAIIASLSRDVASKDYDLLHGLLGKGLYFMEYWPEGKSIAILEKIVDQVASFAIVTEDTACWQQQPQDTTQAPQASQYNLGMAHGMPGIIAFLSKAHQKGIAVGKTKPLLEKSVCWLLRQESPSGQSLFPSLNHSTQESRLAWCYGDLGPALALFHAATALERKDWQQKAIDVALHASQRKIEDAGIWQDASEGRFDPCFCHGTAGIAHIFNRFYQATPRSEFQQAAHYWLSKTVAPMLDKESRPSYTYPKADPSGGVYWCENPALLAGTAGVGLVLLSFMRQETVRWDSIFQTDISFF